MGRGEAVLGRRSVCGMGLGLGLLTLGCTPGSPVTIRPAPVSATPGRRTSTDPDTDRILAEVGPNIIQLTVFADRFFVVDERRRTLVSSGGPFTPAGGAAIGVPAVDAAQPFPADAFPVDTVRRLVRADGGDFGSANRVLDQLVLQVERGNPPDGTTVRCILAPDKPIPVHDHRSEQGVAAGLAELLAVPRQVTYSIGLARRSVQSSLLAVHGRAEGRDFAWTRDQYRPMLRLELRDPPGEALDPAQITARALLRVSDDLLRRAGTDLHTEVRGRSHGGTAVLEFYAGTDAGTRWRGLADLDGRITRID